MIETNEPKTVPETNESSRIVLIIEKLFDYVPSGDFTLNEIGFVSNLNVSTYFPRFHAILNQKHSREHSRKQQQRICLLQFFFGSLSREILECLLSGNFCVDQSVLYCIDCCYLNDSLIILILFQKSFLRECSDTFCSEVIWIFCVSLLEHYTMLLLWYLQGIF